MSSTSVPVTLDGRVASRRRFLIGAGAAGMAGLAAPALFPRYAFAEPNNPALGDLVVYLFLGGGADGLNMVVPHGDPGYYTARPTLAVPKPGRPGGALDLDGFFGLHPRMGNLKRVWDAGHLAIVHAAGYPDNVNQNTSHFEATQYVQGGSPSKSIQTGFLARHAASANLSGDLPAFARDSGLPRTLRGPSPAVSISGFDSFTVGGFPGSETAAIQRALGAIYPRGTSDSMVQMGAATLNAVEVVRTSNPAQYAPQNGATYTYSYRAFGDIARLVRARVGLQVATFGRGGWDDHFNQEEPQANGGTRYSNRVGELSDALWNFYLDLGDAMNEVTVVVMSEFGRTVFENGDIGTDHGRGGVMLVMGRGIRGKKVYGTWPGCAESPRRGLRVTTDYRTVLSEVFERRCGNSRIGRVFPDLARVPYLGVTA